MTIHIASYYIVCELEILLPHLQLSKITFDPKLTTSDQWQSSTLATSDQALNLMDLCELQAKIRKSGIVDLAFRVLCFFCQGLDCRNDQLSEI